MHYAGIGSRETPPAVLEVMAAVGERLAQLGWVLRSGGAVGADQAFERGCDRAGGRKEIFLPWPGFDGHPSPLCTVSAAMLDLAERHHPAWERCRPAARTLLARNGCQVLGPDLATPSRVVIGWTPGGEPVGGTGQAIRIALAHGVPVLNLGRPELAGADAAWVVARARALAEGRL